jgi:GNAT superfamily N-acetyltransferase
MAGPVEIVEARTRSEKSAFIKFPWTIYKNDPAWVPPLILERREFLDRRRHPFYRHGDAGLFLARREGKVVGRIAASDDPNYNAEHGSNVGCFGLFECIDDQSVANALLEAAAGWLKSKGRDEILGPIDYSTNYVCALLVDGFEHPPMVLTAHNPPYYARLIERAGFAKAKDWYAWWIEDSDFAFRRLKRIAARFEKGRGVVLRPGNLQEIEAESERLRSVYNRAWEKNWGFVPFTKAEFDHLRKELRPILIPEFVWLAEADGKAVGFSLAVPNINEVFKKMNGRLTTFGLPIGLAKLLYYKSRLKSARLVALGVIPEFRGLGVAEMLVLKAVENVMINRQMPGELSMTLENNVLINRLIEAVGGRRYKTYRIYQRQVNGTSAATA